MAKEKYPEHLKRTGWIRARTRPGAAEEFRETAHRHGYSESAALREAASDWISKMKRRKT